jgi:hypothetical protein
MITKKSNNGLMTYDKKFNKHSGFIFTTNNFIHKYYNMEGNLRIVELPHDNPDFKMINVNGVKIISNMIILKEKYDFNDLNDFKHIFEINNSLEIIKKIHNVEILEFLKNKGYNLSRLINENMFNIHKNGYTHLLDWIKKSGYELIYSIDNITTASRYGHVSILEWYAKYNYNLKCEIEIINIASRCGYVNILEWFKNSGLKFKHDKWAINYASQNGHINVLEWFEHSGYRLIYDCNAIFNDNININILEWFKRINRDFILNEEFIKYSFEHNNVKALDWIINLYNELNKTFNCNFDLLDCVYYDVNLLQWTKKYGIKLKYDKHIILNVFEYVKGDTFENNRITWFKNNNFKIKFRYVKKYHKI